MTVIVIAAIAKSRYLPACKKKSSITDLEKQQRLSFAKHKRHCNERRQGVTRDVEFEGRRQ